MNRVSLSRLRGAGEPRPYAAGTAPTKPGGRGGVPPPQPWRRAVGRPVYPALLVLLLLLLFAAPAAAQTPPRGKPGTATPWWNDSWSCRKLVQLAPVKDRPPSPFAYVALSTLGLAQEDGADLRVVDAAGAEVPRAVLAAGFEDRVQLAFPAAKPDGRYWVYFGNPRASAPREIPEIKAGLLIEVRELGPGRVSSFDEFRKLLAASPKVLGRGITRAPSLGFNPYGAGTNYVAVFSGWLDCPEEGEYVFATNSWDASFLCIDGYPVAEFPGWHGPDNGQGTHQGRSILTRGPHRFEYYNAVADRGQGCNAGWRPPGAARLAPIPPHAFVGGALGQVVRTERRGEPLAVDFEWHSPHDLGTDDREVVAIQFRDTSTLPDPRTARCEWDFGDGTTGSGKSPLHVYLENGLYTVRLVVAGADGRSTAAAMKVRVRPQYAQGVEGYDRRLAEYWELVKEYSPSQLAPRAALFLGYVAQETGHSEEAIRAWSTVFNRKPPLDDRLTLDALFMLADEYRNVRRDPERALEVLRYVSAGARDPVWHVKADARAAEVLIDLTDDLDGAAKLLAALLSDYARVKTDFVRLALIRQGEIQLLRGDPVKARETLERAQNAPQYKIAYGDFDVQEGSRELSFDEALRRKDFEGARAELAGLVWTLPLTLLEGERYLMQASLSVAEGRNEPAIRELGRFLAARPEANRVPEALLLLGQCHANLGQREAARAAWARIVAEHPHSVECREAERRLAGLGK